MDRCGSTRMVRLSTRPVRLRLLSAIVSSQGIVLAVPSPTKLFRLPGPSVGRLRKNSPLLLSSRPTDGPRSEEHTSELQSHSDLVCRLLLEKKKKKQTTKNKVTQHINITDSLSTI